MKAEIVKPHFAVAIHPPVTADPITGNAGCDEILTATRSFWLARRLCRFPLAGRDVVPSLGGHGASDDFLLRCQRTQIIGATAHPLASGTSEAMWLPAYSPKLAEAIGWGLL